RLRRLATLLANEDGPLGTQPEGPLPDRWLYVLPMDAPLSTPEAWQRLFAQLTPDAWPDGTDQGEHLRRIVALLLRGTSAAEEAGETLLRGKARSIWRTALATGPHATIDLVIEDLKEED